jgi:dolichol-phosphate mannosyltransferase
MIEKGADMILSIIFSFRNEEAVIPELLRRVKDVIVTLNMEYELIFINDASDDRSLELLIQERKQDKNIKIINMSRRFGYTPGVLCGLRHANGDVAINMVSDLQDPPELIPKLLEKWKDGADIVYTTRTRRLGVSLFKAWAIKQVRKIISVLSEINIPSDSSDFKLFSRRAVNEIIKIEEYDPFMRGIVSWIGFKQEEVFYELQPRYKGKSHFPLLRSADPAKEFIRAVASFSSLPIYFILIVGLTLSMAAFLYFIWLVVARIFKMPLTSSSVFIAIMFFLCGLILSAIGTLGIYIWRIYQQVVNRPLYIVKDKIGFNQ